MHIRQLAIPADKLAFFVETADGVQTVVLGEKETARFLTGLTEQRYYEPEVPDYQFERVYRISRGAVGWTFEPITVHIGPLGLTNAQGYAAFELTLISRQTVLAVTRGAVKTGPARSGTAR